MAGDGCCTRTRVAGGSARTGRGAAFAGLLPGLALVAAPKCPLCVAAYLSLLGVSAGVAGPVTPLLRPVGLLLIAAALAFLVRATKRWRA